MRTGRRNICPYCEYERANNALHPGYDPEMPYNNREGVVPLDRNARIVLSVYADTNDPMVTSYRLPRGYDPQNITVASLFRVGFRWRSRKKYWHFQTLGRGKLTCYIVPEFIFLKVTSETFMQNLKMVEEKEFIDV